MGELLGIPEWLAKVLFVGAFLAVLLAIGFWQIGKRHRRVAASRPSPTESEFLAMMEQDCSPKVAKFLWDKALFYVEPKFSPHPDDHLFDDLMIDDDDVAMDWPREWAVRQGFHESNYPDWPEGWPATVRNVGKWLDMAPV